MQFDEQVLNPVWVYALRGQRFARENVLPRYLHNIWLGMAFLEQEGLCLYPELQKGIHSKLKALEDGVVNS
jgi:hypothetical protein